MSLAPIEAGALRQNKLTDHFFVAPTDRRFWDKVHKSSSFGFHSGSKVHQHLVIFIYWGLGSSAWVALKAFFIQRYLAEHMCDRLRIISFLLSSRPITATQVTCFELSNIEEVGSFSILLPLDYRVQELVLFSEGRRWSRVLGDLGQWQCGWWEVRGVER